MDNQPLDQQSVQPPANPPPMMSQPMSSSTPQSSQTMSWVAVGIVGVAVIAALAFWYLYAPAAVFEALTDTQTTTTGQVQPANDSIADIEADLNQTTGDAELDADAATLTQDLQVI